MDDTLTGMPYPCVVAKPKTCYVNSVGLVGKIVGQNMVSAEAASIPGSKPLVVVLLSNPVSQTPASFNYVITDGREIWKARWPLHRNGQTLEVENILDGPFEIYGGVISTLDARIIRRAAKDFLKSL